MSDKVKYEMEFLIQTSTKILYNMISTPSGLSEWFADDVNIRDGVFTFKWDGADEEARLLTKKNNEFIKFQWLEHEEEGEKTYFEFRINVDPITNEVALLITDFADEDEVEEAKDLWENQINDLMHTIGS